MFQPDIVDGRFLLCRKILPDMLYMRCFPFLLHRFLRRRLGMQMFFLLYLMLFLWHIKYTLFFLFLWHNFLLHMLDMLLFFLLYLMLFLLHS